MAVEPEHEPTPEELAAQAKADLEARAALVDPTPPPGQEWKADLPRAQAMIAERQAEARARNLRFLEACAETPPENCPGNLCAGRVDFEGALLDCPLDGAACPFSAARQRAKAERVLAGVGFGARYQHPETERVAEDLRGPLQAYLGDLTRHLEQGTNVICCGGVGTGKTSVLALVALAAVAAGYQVAYWHCLGLFGALHRQEPGVYSAAVSVPLLLLDDFGTQYAAEWSMSWFDNLVEERYSDQRPVWVATNATLKDLSANPLWSRAVDRWRDPPSLTLVTTATSQRR